MLHQKLDALQESSKKQLSEMQEEQDKKLDAVLRLLNARADQEQLVA